MMSFINISALQCVSQNDLCSLRIFCAQMQSHTNCSNNKNNNKPTPLEEVDEYGNTALLKACYQGKGECAQVLIQFGANLKAMNYFGQNALTLATYSGNFALIQELLRHRSYKDFNLSSIVPALCVATLQENKFLMEYFKRLDRFRGADIQTVHGLCSDDIQDMQQKQKQRINIDLL